MSYLNYNNIQYFIAVIIIVLCVFYVVRKIYQKITRRSKLSDCGCGDGDCTCNVEVCSSPKTVYCDGCAFKESCGKPEKK